MFDDLQGIAGIIGGLGVLALAALIVIVRYAPKGDHQRRRSAQESIQRMERQMGKFCRRTTAIESSMVKHVEAGDALLAKIDGKLDTLNGHIIDHLRDHSNHQG